ncbi:MAG: hypothetical protein WC979_05490 [Candidatus Pacearchaeota archaeon]|jgi:hypothetical protein
MKNQIIKEMKISGLFVILLMSICLASALSGDLYSGSTSGYSTSSTNSNLYANSAYGTSNYNTNLGNSNLYSNSNLYGNSNNYGNGYSNYNPNYYGTSYAGYSSYNNYNNLNTNYASNYNSNSNLYGTSSYNNYNNGVYTGQSSNFLGSGTYTGSSINTQYYDPSYGGNYDYTNAAVFWPKFNSQDCTARQDVMMQIMPGGCSPAVVRSDLLEEQNVPVFCKVMSIQINPLIDLTKIRSLSFSGEYPKGISGVSYYPARAAVRKNTGAISNPTKSPINTDMGYLVVVLSQTEAERDMPEFIEGNITATLNYDSAGAYGVGTTNFYASQMSDSDWINNYKQYGFWNGKAYIRAESIEAGIATIGVYKDVNTKEATITLRAGETSRDIYLNGYYCAAGMNVRLDSINAPVDSALLQLNDQQVWVAKGDRILNNACRVVDIQSSGGGGKVTINCPVQNGNIVLSLNPGKATFTSTDGQKDLIIGDKIDAGKNVYIAYLGQDLNSKRFSVLIRDDFSTTVNEFADKGIYEVIQKVVSNNKKSVYDLMPLIKSEVLKQYKLKMGKIDQSLINKNVEVSVIVEGKEGFGVTLDNVLVAQDKNWNSQELSSQDLLALEYYEKAIKNYDDLFTLYQNEKLISTEDSYGAIGLYEAAKLSRVFAMNQKAQSFYDRILSEYPNSNLASSIKSERDFITRYDTTKSKSTINLNGEQYTIDLLDMKTPKKSDSSAVLLIDGKEETLGLNEIKTLNRGEYVQTIQLTGIGDTAISFKYDKSSKNQTTPISKVEKLDTFQASQTSLDGINVKLLHINLNKQVRLTVIPKSFGPNAQSNFKFRIGIEKRAIQLSTNQTQEVMESLLKNIEQLNKIVENLGRVIKIMKAGCFGTSAILSAKNMIAGANGESMARNLLMTGTGGWNEACEKLVNDKQYDTLQQCLLAKNADIENDVKVYSSQIEQTNSIMKSIQDKFTTTRTDMLDLQGQVDSKKVDGEFKTAFDNFCQTQSDQITLPDKDKTKVSFNGPTGICSWNSTLTHEQRRDILTLSNARKSGGSEVLNSVINSKLGEVVLTARNYELDNAARIKAEADASQYNLGLKTLTVAGDTSVYGDVKRITKGDLSNNVYKNNFQEGTSVVRVFIPVRKNFGRIDFIANSEVAGKEVIVQVKGNNIMASGDYSPNGTIVQIDGRPVSQNASKSVRDYMSLAGLDKIKQVDSKAYNNPMVDIEKLTVKYFERAPYKGLPAEVPFDVATGWYVELEYILSGVGKPYDDSGKAVNFYICNVGPNGLIEFKKSSDDICRYYNGNSNADLAFPGMSISESKTLLMKGQQAISDAAKQYGSKRVTINGRSFTSGTSFGGSDGRCTDFMSPADCTILFNVCDPVICPASRCDYGGRYRVDNVIQSGVIGSLLLCLPNAKEGVAIPVCLTGVNAGLEGYISILNSTYQCLNESLTTGKNIGVCDEIKSIYLCEFFWKQAAPLLNVLVPRMLEMAAGQGVRGGGEYLTVQNAWDNTMNAVDYFKNQYAVNSMSAFSSRSSEDVGTEVCKNFISVAGNTNGTSWFDRLIEPDSPVQYSAWFSEDVLSTATVPATSHYKVYYHIYSGKDLGSSYVVYLKDTTQTSGVYSTGSLVVARGYIAIGSQVDEAKDFTAPSGYKQLCVSVNGKDDCGFGKVSTSYMLNSLTDQYAADQVSQTQITSSSQCVAGTPSLISSVSPNLQANVESTIDSALYNQGIIRVCATENPGKKLLASGQYDTTNSTYDRWKDVGYCDDSTLRCWIDTNSVKSVIKDTQLESQVLQNVDLSRIGEEQLWTEETTISVLNQAENEIDKLDISKNDSRDLIESKINVILYNLDRLAILGTTNIYKARGLLLTARMYKKIAESLVSDKIIMGDNYGVVTQTSSSSNNLIDSSQSTGALTDNTNANTDTVGTPIATTTPLVWNDEMLKKDVLIRVEYLTSTHAYKFSSTGWLTDDSGFNTRLSYIEGIKAIIGAINFKGNIIIGTKVITVTTFSSTETVSTEIFQLLKNG